MKNKQKEGYSSTLNISTRNACADNFDSQQCANQVFLEFPCVMPLNIASLLSDRNH